MERKLVKPKEKMLPSSLFDLQRFHKLKSKTGVESRELENMLRQARIAQESQDYGLSLQFARQSSRLSEIKEGQDGKNEDSKDIAELKEIQLGAEGINNDSIGGIQHRMESAMEPNHFGDVVNTRMGEEETKMGREQN